MAVVTRLGCLYSRSQLLEDEALTDRLRNVKNILNTVYIYITQAEGVQE